MKIKDLYEHKNAKLPTIKPRNFVAKNAPATTSGAGAHKDKKKAAKNGQQKHKNKDISEGFKGGFFTSLTALELRKYIRSVMQSVASDFSEFSSNKITTSPSAPDTTKFKSQASSMISQVSNMVHHGSAYGFAKTFLEFLKIGSNLPANIKSRIVSKLSNELSAIIPNLQSISTGTTVQTADGYQFVFNLVSGTNWGGIGVYLQKPIKETATAGATSAANVGTVVSPHIAIGKDRGNKSYTGSPGKSGTKAPKVPKVTQPKNKDGTAKNALDSNTNIFGGAIKR